MGRKILGIRCTNDQLWQEAVQRVLSKGPDWTESISQFITWKIIAALGIENVDPHLTHFGSTLEHLRTREVEYLNVEVEDDGSTELGYGPEVRTTIDEINRRIASLGLVAFVIQEPDYGDHMLY